MMTSKIQNRINQFDISKYSPAIELFTLSAISLFIELLVIRWMSADIRAFTIFRTFPLVACFIGLGVGFAIRNDKNYRYLPISILLFALMMKLADLSGISLLSYPTLSIFQWNNLSGLLQISSAYLLVFMLGIILFLAIPFGMCACIGARLGILFSTITPLTAYSLNISGAILGSILFPVLSALSFPPLTLLLLPAIIVSADLIIKTKKFRYAYLIPLAFLAILQLPSHEKSSIPLSPVLKTVCQIEEQKTLWSPYQRIDLSTFIDKYSPKQEFLGLELSVNHLFYQYFINTKQGTIFDKIHFSDLIKEDYNLPFSFNSAKDILIIGAGTGQNVSSAVSMGAKNIDAVEIDPLILNIGKKYNPDYSNPYVHLICDDARHFMSQTKQKYDVINFSTLDSHTVAGLGSSVRLDSYIYTKESIAKALSLLNENGIIHVSFATVAPWIKERLYKTFSQAAGYNPVVLEGKMIGTIYLLGPNVKNRTIKVPTQYKQLKIDELQSARILTDDWPYLYVQPDIIDWPHLLVLSEITLIGVYATRKFLFRKSPSSVWHMFFLGAAFMLLELHAISFLSLLYGSTWITSAVVINCILIMIFITNYCVIRFRPKLERSINTAYIALFASIIFNYFLPTEILLTSTINHSLLYGILTLITVLPMSIAALIFSISFAKAPNVSQALAFNLFGAVIGGILECLSNWWGIKSLNLVAITLYLASAFFYFNHITNQQNSSSES